jgi:hypothetical protein
MKLIHALAASALLLLSPLGLYAQAYMQAPSQSQVEKEDQVKTAEVFRRGDHVEHIGVTRSTAEDLYLAAVSTPADDSNKWFITIYSMPNCRYCDELIKDFRTQKPLQSFANPTDPKASWAHFNVYSNDDGAQEFRFKAIKIKEFPTIVIQPPRNGRFGDPSAIVMQKSGYKSTKDSAYNLAKQMSESVKKYVKTISPTPAPNPDPRVVQQPPVSVIKPYQSKAPSYPRQFSNAESGGYKGLWGEDPRGGILPFKPKPKEPTPATPVPAPDNTPVPDMDIPTPLNPDAPVAPPVAPVDPNAPPTGPPPADTKPVATIIVDGNKLVESIEHPKMKALLSKLRIADPNISIELLSFEKARERFPKLLQANLPAVTVTKDGVTQQALTNVTAELDPFPWSALLSMVATGGFNVAGGIAIAIWLFKRIRARRAAQGTPPVIPDNALAALNALLASPQVQEWINNLSKPKAPTTP